MTHSESHAQNEAAALIERLLRLKRPQLKEKESYFSMAEALTILSRVSGLSREDVAFRLGISVSMLDKATAGVHGGNLNAIELERVIVLARECNLPRMVEYLRIMHIEARSRPIRGTKVGEGRKWWRRDDKLNE